MDSQLVKYLKEIEACKEAIEWVGYKTLEQAWNECERGDWMLWLAYKKNVDHRKLTLAKARCAKLVYHLIKDERSRNAADVAERYGLGEATRDELDRASNAAYVAAYAAYTAVSAAAVYAAAAAYAANDARTKTLKKCADICREILTEEVCL